MTIRKKVAVQASDSHYRFGDSADTSTSETKITQGQGAQMLHDPEDDTPMDTHSIQAKAKSKLTADPLDEFFSTGDETEDLLQASNEDEEDDQDFDLDEEEVNSALNEEDEEMPAVPSSGDASELTAEDDSDSDDEEDEDGDEGQWDPEPEEDDEVIEEDEDDMEDVAEPEDVVEGADTDVNFSVLPDEQADGADVLNVVDLDEVPDDDVDGLVFASFGNTLMALRGTRVIASMTKRRAVQASIDDVYMTQNFPDAVAAECMRFGLRAGLSNMGFRLETVNFGTAKANNQRIEAKVKALTAKVKKQYQNKQKNFASCMAIASTGINRNFFAKVGKNELKAAMEAILANAGVKNGNRLVQAAFAKHGISYTKSVIALAERINSMPEQVQREFASSLDMIDDQGEFQEAISIDEDFGTGSDFVDAAEGDEVDYDEEFLDEDEESEGPRTVEAALNSYGRPTVPTRAKQSVTASAVLRGEAPLF